MISTIYDQWLIISARTLGPKHYFFKQIDLCVDNKMFGTAWTNHTIMPGIEHKDKRPTRPSFKSDVSGKNRFLAGASSSTMEKYEKLWLSICNIKYT